MRRLKGEIYEYNSFPTHWENFDKLIKEGIIVSCPPVKKELLFNSNEFKGWCEENKKMFIPLTPIVTEEMDKLDEEYPLWFNSEKNTEVPWADSSLVAYAKAYKCALVTQEHMNLEAEEQNYKIPTICEKLGAFCSIGKMKTKNNPSNTTFQCIDFIELVKREKLMSNN